MFLDMSESQKIFSHTTLCIFYVILRLVALRNSGTAHNLDGAVLTVTEDCGQRPSCVRRCLILFPYLHSHHNVPFHTTACCLSNSLLVQPPTQQIGSKFTPETGDSKLYFRLSDLCTGSILVFFLQLYPHLLLC
jgi:hypothetical protein